ncbi:MAG: glycosyl transferase family 2 [Petrimonas sp.]|nr:glycosyl transferase family 2 [Petrimonas sp.]MEA5080309.1 glycosyl transferase family 2 [Dysgonamonadaceae bacterium]
MSQIFIIIQARTGSKRLPNKMIKSFYNDKSLLEITIERLKSLNIPIIVATTKEKNDDAIESIAISKDVLVFRGDENDVLSRFIEAATKFNVEKIIRICADNPLLDLSSILDLKNSFTESNVDYWCFATHDKTPTIKTHYGFWGEGVTINALKRIKELTSENLYREHVTNYIYTHPDKFSIHYEIINPIIERNKLRLTLDTKNDFELIRKIYSDITNNKIIINALNVSNFVLNRKDWLEIMENEIKLNAK